MDSATISGWAVTSREVVIPAADLTADRLPRISVRSGEPSEAWVAVTYRPRLIVRRGSLWTGLAASMDWAGCLFLLLALPAIFILHPLLGWATYLLPEEMLVRGVLPATAAEADWIPFVRNAALVTGLATAALIVAVLAGAQVGWLLGVALCVGAILGAIDYYSLPVGRPATVNGHRVVILNGVHQRFAAAVEAMRPAGEPRPDISRRLGRRGTLLVVFASAAILVGPAAFEVIHSTTLQDGWASLGPCTVQLNSHDMNATASGPGAKDVCNGWLQNGSAAGPSGSEMCTYSNGELTVVVRDSGGMTYGAGLCNALDQWVRKGGAVPSLDSLFVITDLPDITNPSPTS